MDSAKARIKRNEAQLGWMAESLVWSELLCAFLTAVLIPWERTGIRSIGNLREYIFLQLNCTS